MTEETVSAPENSKAAAEADGAAESGRTADGAAADGQTAPTSLKAFLSGKAVPLENVPDEVFSQHVMGDGMAIEPTDNTVVAPADAEVSVVMEDSRHACGLTLANGMEVLIHVGIDTVNMQGDGFELFVKQGDKVKKGQLLLDVDLKLLREKGYSTQTPVLVVNPDDMSEIQVTDQKQTAVNDDFITVHFKR